MVISVLEEPAEQEGSPLSEEVEQEILEMVEDQLDRPNPPDTKVLYRRAMHFIDRDVRHLSLQQFNAKFPLRVKRRKARERTERTESRIQRTREESDGHGTDDASDGGGGRREAVRETLLDFAKAVTGAEDRGAVIDVLTGVDEYVDRVVEEM